MSVTIGHASINEFGKIKGGELGDQNKKEVCRRKWYNKPWRFMLRPSDPDFAERTAKACEAACDNDLVGYDQNYRNTLHKQSKLNNHNISAISVPCATDCSQLMTECAIVAGATVLDYPITGNAPTTSTMVNKFVASGYYKLHTEPHYLTTDEYLKRGDILVQPGKHTVMVLEDGKKANESVIKKPVEEIVAEVLAGKWGNGAERRGRLTEAGYDPKEIQELVNVIKNG